jgi:hypothetical protein
MDVCLKNVHHHPTTLLPLDNIHQLPLQIVYLGLHFNGTRWQINNVKVLNDHG